MATGAPSQFRPTIAEIRSAFEDEIARLHGTVSGRSGSGERQFLRAVLPRHADVARHDPVQAGVAIRVSGPELLICPYTMRLVCTNGAVAVHALETRRIQRSAAEVESADRRNAGVLDRLRDATRACAAEPVFVEAVSQMRRASEVPGVGAHRALASLIPRASRTAAVLVRMATERYERAPDPDRSAFGLMNAVTSVARDTPDPEWRWRLEELGAGIPAGLTDEKSRAPGTVSGVWDGRSSAIVGPVPDDEYVDGARRFRRLDGRRTGFARTTV